MSTCGDQPDESSSTDVFTNKYHNRNIKERLNMHVKRRLQETSNEQSSSTSSIPQNHISFGTSHTSPSTPQKRGSTSERGGSITHGSGRGGKKSRIAKHLTSSVSSTSSACPDDECSRDESSNCADLNRDKVQSPDILTMVLNQKKLSLFNDPEVVKFLDGIVGVIGKKTTAEDSGCVS